MSESVSIPIEADTSGAVASLKSIRQESEATAQTLKRAFAADVLVENLGRVASAFGGVTGAAINAGAAIARGISSRWSSSNPAKASRPAP